MRGLPAGPGGPLRKSNGRSPASLGADIEEIDALLAASKRARTSVAERASKLMSEHAAVQRGFERELDRETLRQKPKEKLKRRSGADHALLFHLAHAPDQPADEAAAAAAERPRRRKPEETPQGIFFAAGGRRFATRVPAARRCEWKTLSLSSSCSPCFSSYSSRSAPSSISSHALLRNAVPSLWRKLWRICALVAATSKRVKYL